MFLQNCMEYIRKHRQFIGSDPEKHLEQIDFVMRYVVCTVHTFIEF